MITQQFDLNMIPDCAPVVVHVDQYDIGAGRLVAALYDGNQPYTPHSAATVQIQGTKSDGHSFLYDAAISGNVVTADLTEQMTAAAGDARVQLVVREYTGRTGTFVFILRVQKSALPSDADMSESDLAAVEELIETAAGIVEDATDAAQDAEAWAQGTRGGDPVGPTDPTYEHNAAYWAAYAEQCAEGALHYKGSIAFANIPITGMVEGDMYNITDDFVTDSRFAEGAGVHAKAGTNIAYDLNDKWDLLAMPQIPTMTASEQGIGRPDGMTADVTQGVFRAKGVAIYSTVNPIGTEYGADWLKYGDTVITPSNIQLYLVYIAGKPTLWTWDLTEQEYVKVPAEGSGGGGGLVSILQDDFDELTTAEKNDPTIWWWISDAEGTISSGGSGGVSSFNGRTGSVTPQAGDYTPAMIGLTLDNTPTENSANAVKSGGVFSALDGIIKVTSQEATVTIPANTGGTGLITPNAIAGYTPMGYISMGYYNSDGGELPDLSNPITKYVDPIQFLPNGKLQYRFFIQSASITLHFVVKFIYIKSEYLA